MSDLPSSTPPSYFEATAIPTESKNGDNISSLDQLQPMSKKELITTFTRMSEEKLENLFKHLNIVDNFNPDPDVRACSYFDYHIINPLKYLKDIKRGVIIIDQGDIKHENALKIFKENWMRVFNLTVAYRNIIGWGKNTTELMEYKSPFCDGGDWIGFNHGKINTIEEFDEMVFYLIKFKWNPFECGLINKKNYYANDNNEKKKVDYTNRIIYCLDRMLAFMKECEDLYKILYF